MLTGVRTGELRFATPDQFDLDRGLWIIPVARLKQRKLLTRKKRKRLIDIPPYIVPLSVQAQEIVRHLLDNCKPAQVYLIPGDWCLKNPISENTLNAALKRMGYEDQLTGHGIRATISTALNELGYPKKWVDAQLSHADPDRISATYNHAEYVEQRRVMMQDWADRLDLFEQNQVEVASRHLTITLQGLPTIAGQAAVQPPVVDLTAPQLIVTAPAPGQPEAPASVQRLSAVRMPEYARPRLSEVQRERQQVLETFEAPHNLSVADYARLAGKSRRWITYEIQAGNLLSIHMGHRGHPFVLVGVLPFVAHGAALDQHPHTLLIQRLPMIGVAVPQLHRRPEAAAIFVLAVLLRDRVVEIDVQAKQPARLVVAVREFAVVRRRTDVVLADEVRAHGDSLVVGGTDAVRPWTRRR